MQHRDKLRKEKRSNQEKKKSTIYGKESGGISEERQLHYVDTNNENQTENKKFYAIIHFHIIPFFKQACLVCSPTRVDARARSLIQRYTSRCHESFVPMREVIKIQCIRKQKNKEKQKNKKPHTNQTHTHTHIEKCFEK